MISLARHRVNDHEVGAAPRLREEVFGGLDLDRARERVLAQGGDLPRFDAALAHGAAAVRATGPEIALTLAAMAGWRAGVVGLRRDALERARRWRFTEIDALAGALLLPVTELEPFLAGQHDDPFFWPGRSQVGPVAYIGGFRGFGGPWLTPPTEYGPLPHPQEFWVRTVEGDQRLRADAFGARLTPLRTAVPDRPPRGGPSLEPLGPHSYLLALWVRP